MPTVRNVGAGTARQLGGQLLSEGLRTRDIADQLSIQTILTEREKNRIIPEALTRFAQSQEERRADRKAARAGKKSAVGGIIGTGVGAVAGVVLAPFTAGASLALTVASAGVGAGIGGAIGQATGSLLEDDPNAGLRASGQVQNATRQIAAAGQAGLSREGRQKRLDTAQTEMPPDAFFDLGRPEAEGGFSGSAPAKEATKTFGIVKEDQKAGVDAPVADNLGQRIDIGFGVVWDPVTGEMFQLRHDDR